MVAAKVFARARVGDLVEVEVKVEVEVRIRSLAMPVANDFNC